MPYSTPPTSNYGPGILGVAAGIPVYGGSTATSPPPIALCCTASTRFAAGEEQQGQKHLLSFAVGAVSYFSEVSVSAIYWDIGVLPNENPIRDLVGAFEEMSEDDIHTDPMALFGAGVWVPKTVHGYVAPQVPMSFGLPPGPLPRTQWCRAGGRLSKHIGIPAASTFSVEIGFTRKWAPSRDVDLTFTLELA